MKTIENKSFRISDFLSMSYEDFLGHLTSIHSEAHVSLASPQVSAWKKEYDDLKRVLEGKQGRVLFEYSIPNLPNAIDVVLLLAGKIFVLEYKENSDSYCPQDVRQVNGYALRLKYFHSRSNDNWIIPILVASKAPQEDLNLVRSEDDMVCSPIKCNSHNLAEAIDLALSHLPGKPDTLWEDSWEKGIYKASPTIIDAARNVWKNNNVSGFKQGESSEETRLKAEDYIINTVVEETKRRKGKSICFVTGVPGAGKTLVGLNISARLQDVGASLLSGNGPLVAVLSAALKIDLEKNKKHLVRPKDELSVDSVIRGAYGYKKEIFEKRLDYTPGEGSVSLKDGAEKSEQHVLIFDEAQRAWDKNKLISPGQSGRKVWQEEAFPFSEPGLLLWDMNQRDWGVFVCLVGGGQEINTGEAGICEWFRSIKSDSCFSEWQVYISDQLCGQEYNSKSGDGETLESYKDYFRSQNRLVVDPSLHLTACQRSNRTEKLSELVQAVLDCKSDAARNIYEDIKSRYQIYLTRDLPKAKEKLRERRLKLLDRSYLNGIDDEDFRIGMLMSSRAARLRAYGYNIIKVSSFLKQVHRWFLDPTECINSSNFLELAMNEFFVQGLEVDYSVVMWDADLRYNPKTNEWDFYIFSTNGKQWSKIPCDTAHEITRFYMKNAYRVLLTRARAGMIIFVPKGSELSPEGTILDPTRKASFYDNTYQFFKEIGFKKL